MSGDVQKTIIAKPTSEIRSWCSRKYSKTLPSKIRWSGLRVKHLITRAREYTLTCTLLSGGGRCRYVLTNATPCLLQKERVKLHNPSNPENRTIIPIILTSDKTQLGAFSGTATGWPLYMTIGNVVGYERFKRSNRCIRLIAWLPTDIGTNPKLAKVTE